MCRRLFWGFLLAFSASRMAAAIEPLAVPFSSDAALAAQQRVAESLHEEVVTSNSIGMKLTIIPPGIFKMGSPKDEYGSLPWEPQHPVELSRPIRMGVYEVTQAEFRAVMGRNPAHFSPLGDGKAKIKGIDWRSLPVEEVSWFDAVAFCNALSQREGLREYYRMENIERLPKAERPTEEKSYSQSIYGATVEIVGGNGYRLPTEAEWEFACRAGTETAFHFGMVNDGSNANVDAEEEKLDTRPNRSNIVPGKPALKRSATVGTYQPNAFGLHDMHGNVAEWCADWYDSKFYRQVPGIVRDPLCTEAEEIEFTGTSRVVRGGEWSTLGISRSRSGARFIGNPDIGGSDIGIRIVRNVDAR